MLQVISKSLTWVNQLRNEGHFLALLLIFISSGKRHKKATVFLFPPKLKFCPIRFALSFWSQSQPAGT